MNKKIVAVFCLIVSMVLITIAACGCSTEGSSGATPFSETVSGEDVRIWYECQNIITEEEEDPMGIFSEDYDENAEPEPPEFGRETRVIWIKVYRNGKLSSYSSVGNVYLGEFAKMTDEEIISELESNNKKFIQGQKEEDFEIYLYSDKTGQEVVFEGVPSLIKQGKKDNPMYYMTLISKEQIDTFQVYDSYYGGFTLYSYDETEPGEAIMITRCEASDKFTLDGLDLEGAVIDYLTPAEMLIEKNNALKKTREKEAEDANGERSKE